MRNHLSMFLNKHKKIYQTLLSFCLCCLFVIGCFYIPASAAVLPFDNVVYPNVGCRLASYSGAGDYVNISSAFEFVQADGFYHFDNSVQSSSGLLLRFRENSWETAISTDIYDYYLQVILYASDVSMQIDISTASVREFYFDDGSNYRGFLLEDFVTFDYDGSRDNSYYYGEGCIGRLPSDFGGNFGAIRVNFSYDSVLPADLMVGIYLYRVDKSTGGTLADVVNAINGTTSAVDNLTHFTINGDNFTEQIVSIFEDTESDLDNVVHNYEGLQSAFEEDFNTNQSIILEDINGWSWGGLQKCANWVGSTLTSYYNNMGDFKQYIIYPLMLGIALFFIGRGSSIIGHLYKKPTVTFTSTKSESYKMNGVRNTTTVTFREGGKFRK